MASEKLKSLQDVVANLTKETRSHIQFGNEVEIRRVPTPSAKLNQALKGGWAMGRFGLIWGAKSAGKTTFLLQQIAIAQQMGLVCGYFDVERAYDKTWATANGVDTSELLVTKSGTVNDLVNDGAALLRAGVDLIVVDSLSFIMPGTFIEKDGELKPFENTGAIGGVARSVGPALAQLNYANKRDALILFVSQVRMAQKGSMHWGQAPTGGKAQDHAVSQSVKLAVSEGKDALIKGEVTVGDRIIEKPIGRKVTWTVDKDRVGPGLGSTGEYTLYFDGDHIGVDKFAELLETAVEYGVIQKAGAWYKYNDAIVGQGEVAAANKLRADDVLYDKVLGELNAR
jgi:recombination protein RecA